MNDAELDAALATLDPHPRREVEGYDLAGGERELLAEIVGEPVDVRAPKPAGSGRRSLRVAAAIAGLAAATAVMVLILGSTGDGGPGGPSRAYAADAIEVAKANRRLLVSEPGWGVTYATFEGPDYGEVQFSETGVAPEDATSPEEVGDLLDMHWYAEQQFQERTRPDGHPVTIAGIRAYAYKTGDTSFTAVLPVRNGNFTLITGVAPSLDRFEQHLGSIVSVSVDEWLGAMPDSVVLPVDLEAEADRLLENVPLPKDFDRSTVVPASMPQDEYQLTAYVLRGAYCGWLDEWWRADRAGDEAAADEAIEQLLNAEHWPAVEAQASEGSLDQDFRQYANTVASGKGDKQVYDQMENCVEYP